MAVSDSIDLADDLKLLEETCARAGEIALQYFKAENEVWMKSGQSPVSQADIAVNDFLQSTLLGARPDYGWISEETEDNSSRLNDRCVFVVDPIDGTRGFINGQNEWCISVAIVKDGDPVVAVLECPALNESYAAMQNQPAACNGKAILTLVSRTLERVTGSKKINELLNQISDDSLKVNAFVPSLAYRIVMVATGKLDAAFARPGAHEWDLAAADLIIRCADGCLLDKNGSQLKYNSKKLHRESLIACPASLKNSALELAKSHGILH